MPKPGVDLLAHIGPEIAVGVLQVPDVGRRGDEHASFPGCDARRPEQAVGEDVALIEAAVAVGVAQQPHSSQRRLAGPGLVGIIAHLGDVEVAVGVEGRGDRALHQRLGRDQLHAEPVHGLECLQRFIGR